MKKWLISFFITSLVLAGCTEPQNSSVKETNSVEKASSNNDNLSKEEQKNQASDTNPSKETTKQEDSSVNQSSSEKSSGSTPATYEKQGDNNSTSADKVSNYPTYEATIISVVDGDTVKASASFGNKTTIEKYRLILVDTPETVKRGVKIQPFGVEASAYTKSVLKPGTKVLIEKDVQERDPYGRLLAYVYVNGKMLNETLLEKGLARVAVFPPNTRYVDEFRKIQDKARQQQLGIWSIEGYVGDKGYNTSAKGLTNSSTSEKSQNSTPNTSTSNKSDSSSYSKQTTNSATSTNNAFENNPADDVETNTSCKGKIKGNANSKIYHLPDGAYYDKTVDNIVWFCTEQDAQKQGYRKSQR